jgi:hypothetical protein
MQAKDPEALKTRYHGHLRVPLEEGVGAAFTWRSAENPDGVGTTVWSLFQDTSAYFDPSPSQFMIDSSAYDLHGRWLPPPGAAPD